MVYSHAELAMTKSRTIGYAGTGTVSSATSMLFTKFDDGDFNLNILNYTTQTLLTKNNQNPDLRVDGFCKNLIYYFFFALILHKLLELSSLTPNNFHLWLPRPLCKRLSLLQVWTWS